jgi:hypothetical protein
MREGAGRSNCQIPNPREWRKAGGNSGGGGVREVESAFAEGERAVAEVSGFALVENGGQKSEEFCILECGSGVAGRDGEGEFEHTFAEECE